MMTTIVRAASSVTLSVASVLRRVVALRRIAVPEAVLPVVVLPEARLRENQTVVAVAPAVTRTTITPRAAVVEAAEGSFVTKPTKLSKPCFRCVGGATARNRLPLLIPTSRAIEHNRYDRY